MSDKFESTADFDGAEMIEEFSGDGAVLRGNPASAERYHAGSHGLEQAGFAAAEVIEVLEPCEDEPPIGSVGCGGDESTNALPKRVIADDGADADADAEQAAVITEEEHGAGTDVSNSDAAVLGGEQPRVEVGPGRLDEAVRAALALLAGTGRYFRRSDGLVSIAVDPLGRTVHARLVTAHDLQRTLDSLANWGRFNAAGKWIRQTPPANVVKAVLRDVSDAALPVLAGVANQPFLRPDGSLCSQEGYDPATGVLAGFGGVAFNVPSHPTRKDADGALGRLDALLEEFAFAGEIDRAAALSAMLTAVVRPSLTAAPLFHVSAHQAGTGKTYLCKVIAAFASSAAPRTLSFPHGDAECAKMLVAALREAPAVIELDNLGRDIQPYDSLCAVLTSEHYAGRSLGASHMKAVGTRSLFLSSGNNVVPVGDMARRCVTIKLDAGCDTPAARTFRNVRLLEQVRQNRAALVSDALTVILAWIAAGRPRCASGALASFGEWLDLCREPLVWLGKPDPATSVFDAMTHDPQRQQLGRLLVLIEREFGSGNLLVKDLIARAAVLASAGYEELQDTLADIAGEGRGVNRQRLGHWFRRHDGRVVEGLRLVNADVARNAQVWRVEKR